MWQKSLAMAWHIGLAPHVHTLQRLLWWTSVKGWGSAGRSRWWIFLNLNHAIFCCYSDQLWRHTTCSANTHLSSLLPGLMPCWTWSAAVGLFLITINFWSPLYVGLWCSQLNTCPCDGVCEFNCHNQPWVEQWSYWMGGMSRSWGRNRSSSREGRIYHLLFTNIYPRLLVLLSNCERLLLVIRCPRLNWNESNNGDAWVVLLWITCVGEVEYREGWVDGGDDEWLLCPHVRWHPQTLWF